MRRVRDLARVVHAQLDDRVAMPRREPQQRQRHADVVVEVAARREASGPAPARIAASISLTVVLPLLPATPTTERRELRRARRARARRARPARPGRRPAASASRRRARRRAPAAPRAAAAATKSWPSKRSPRSATNRSPALERARVGRHAGKRGVGAVQRAAGGRGERRRAASFMPRPASERAALGASLNGRRSSPTIW